ncbi:MAG: hypothetical protein Q9M97_01575 [Candidatus Gracilibacteria bacterium]|nr:hypothetical protein [Candidatus Gracilibacteria bacterium]
MNDEIKTLETEAKKPEITKERKTDIKQKIAQKETEKVLSFEEYLQK